MGVSAYGAMTSYIARKCHGCFTLVWSLFSSSLLEIRSCSYDSSLLETSQRPLARSTSDFLAIMKKQDKNRCYVNITRATGERGG